MDKDIGPGVVGRVVGYPDGGFSRVVDVPQEDFVVCLIVGVPFCGCAEDKQ